MRLSVRRLCGRHHEVTRAFVQLKLAADAMDASGNGVSATLQLSKDLLTGAADECDLEEKLATLAMTATRARLSQHARVRWVVPSTGLSRHFT